MSSLKRIHADRTEICIELWSLLLDGTIKSRDEARALLKQYYDERQLEPFRGKSKIDLYDKELITLYIIGKYGLGIHEDARDVIRRIFPLERKCERAYRMILEGRNPREVMLEIFGTLDSSLLFRVLRFAVTLTLLGFEKESNLVKVLHAVANSFPEYSSRFPLFARFYVALKLSEAIALGKVRNNLEKEALKHAICMKLGFSKCAPSDSMVYDVAKNVYKVREGTLMRVLSLKKVEEKQQSERNA